MFMNNPVIKINNGGYASEKRKFKRFIYIYC